jgi:23S rRNA pseudouridine2605 synthase
MKTPGIRPPRAGDPQPPASPASVPLARALSKWGVCSRSRAEVLVRDGCVTVGGKVVTDPQQRIAMRGARVTVEGRRVEPAGLVYVMLNKPRGVVTTAADEHGRPTVYAPLAEAALPWLGPVGRLDKASEGLLLLTNDTRLGARLLAPGAHVDKCYHVQIDRLPDAALCAQLMEGVRDTDGSLLRAKRAAVLRVGGKHGWLEIVLDEGKNRQIRRLLEALGVAVTRLVRVAFGPLPLGDLAKGAFRHLTPQEVAALRRAANPGTAPGAGV